MRRTKWSRSYSWYEENIAIIKMGRWYRVLYGVSNSGHMLPALGFRLLSDAKRYCEALVSTEQWKSAVGYSAKMKLVEDPEFARGVALQIGLDAPRSPLGAELMTALRK